MKQKKRPTVVIAPEGCSTFFIAGKEYKVIEFWGKSGMSIRGEKDVICPCLKKNCAFLNGQDWIVKSREGDKKRKRSYFIFVIAICLLSSFLAYLFLFEFFFKTFLR